MNTQYPPLFRLTWCLLTHSLFLLHRPTLVARRDRARVHDNFWPETFEGFQGMKQAHQLDSARVPGGSRRCRIIHIQGDHCAMPLMRRRRRHGDEFPFREKGPPK